MKIKELDDNRTFGQFNKDADPDEDEEEDEMID
jgi:hypothetical protein